MMNKPYKFFDTCALLDNYNNLINDDFKLVISTISLKELEEIKTSKNKNNFIQADAQRTIKVLQSNRSKYMTIIHKEEYEEEILKKGLPLNNDTRILSDAIWFDKTVGPDNTSFVTNDLSLFNIANLFFGDDSIENFYPTQTPGYSGFIEVTPTDEQYIEIYQNNNNIFNLLDNQYIILRYENGDVVDLLYWKNNKYNKIKYGEFTSIWLDPVKPMSGDPYQAIACDSLMRNKLTILRGKAGTGKSLLALSYLMSKLDKGEIDKIIIFSNPVATLGSARLG